MAEPEAHYQLGVPGAERLPGTQKVGKRAHILRQLLKDRVHKRLPVVLPPVTSIKEIK